MHIPPPPAKPTAPPPIGRAVVAEPTLDSIVQAQAWRTRHRARLEYCRIRHACSKPHNWTRIQ